MRVLQKEADLPRPPARATSSITPESMSTSPWTTQTRSTPSICESDNSMPDNVRRPLLTVRAASTKLCPCGVNSIPDALCVRASGPFQRLRRRAHLALGQMQPRSQSPPANRLQRRNTFQNQRAQLHFFHQIRRNQR